MSVDTDEGDVTVRTRDGAININADGGDVTINVEGSSNVHVGGQGGQELATKEFVMLQYNLHTHASPAGPTGPPITPAPMTPGGDITEKTKAE